MRDPEITIEPAGPGSGVLRWQRHGEAAPESLIVAIRTATSQAFAGSALHRIEADVPADDHAGRRALLRSGFRWEEPAGAQCWMRPASRSTS
ncbi:hypothetical protein GCM10027613_45300 [Microlunatus endophyticus]